MLADISHDVIWTLDIALQRFTYISPSVTELRGYTVPEALRQPLVESLSGESAARLLDEIAHSQGRIAAGDRAAQVLTSELDQL